MEATMEAVGLMLVGVAIGAVLASVWHRQWLAVGIEVRGMAADHLERSRAHLDRAARHLKLVQEVEGRWGIEPQDVRPRSGAISYPGHMVYVDEVRPGESIWEAAERERREKLAKNADLGANPGKTVLEDARGGVSEGDRRGEDGAKSASGGDPWFGWTGPPDPPVVARLSAGSPDGRRDSRDTTVSDRLRARPGSHGDAPMPMIELHLPKPRYHDVDVAALGRKLQHLKQFRAEATKDFFRCPCCGHEAGGHEADCVLEAERMKLRGELVTAKPRPNPPVENIERKLRQDRERIEFEAEPAPMDAHDAMCGFQGGAECDCTTVYRTMEEVEAVHGPVVETFEPRYRSPLDIANPANYFDTAGRCVAGPLKDHAERFPAPGGPVVQTFEPRCSYCGENHGLECPRALCIDCRAPRSHHSGRNCTADPPIFEDSVRRAYEKRYEAAPLCLVCGGYHDGECSLAFSHTSKDGVPVYVRREPDPAFDSMPGDSPEMIAIKRSQAAFASGEREEIEAPMVPHDSLPLGPEVAGPGFAPTGCPACGRMAHFGQCPALGPGPCLTRASVPSGREGRQADADTER